MGLMENIRLNIFQILSPKMVLICLHIFAIQPLVENKFSMDFFSIGASCHLAGASCHNGNCNGVCCHIVGASCHY